MTGNVFRRFAQAALIVCLALPAASLLPASIPLATSKAHAAVPVPSDKPDTANLAEFKRVLSEYGAFATHPRYGEIWVPNVTPPGWHPYPACQWVYTKDGWYFNDETPWGSIVHHYGRWSHDEKVGWFWVPDEDWSPGWVVWRKSDRWVGWAPMPPEQDAHLIASRDFNNDKFWTFMEAKKFFNGGCGTTVRATQVIHLTKHVTIFNLPPGLLVEVIFVPKWKIKVIIKLVTIVVDHVCPAPGVPWKPTKLHAPVIPAEPKPDKPRVSIDKPSISIDTPTQRPGILVKPGKPPERPIFVRPIIDKPIGIVNAGDKPSKPNGRSGRRPDGSVVSETPKGIHQLR
jgi:uncharacterized protein DUF6600